MSRLRADIERFLAWRGHVGPVLTVKFLVTCLNPRMAPVVLLRLAEMADARGLGLLAKLCAMFNVSLFGLEVSPKVTVGGGVMLPHTVGTVIGADRIGNNCTIMQGVTLGTTDPESGYTPTLRPVIGDGVLIGAGAKVLGRVHVGDHARIGANAVVIDDVPPHAIAVGVPARILVRSDRDASDAKQGGDAP